MGLSADQALDIAQTIVPFQRTIDLSFSKENRSNLGTIARPPKVVKTSKRNVIRELTKLAFRIRQGHQRPAETMGEKPPTKHLGEPLIARLAKKLSYGGRPIPRDLAKGANITGETPLPGRRRNASRMR